MKLLTFDRLPEAVTQLTKQVNELKTLIVEKQDNPPTEKERLLTIQEAAKFLSLAVPTLYVKVSKRDIPFMKQGKRLYFSESELLEWIKAGRKKTVAEIKQEAQNYIKKGGNNE